MKPKPFNPALYKKIGINKLILFSVRSVSDKNEKCTSDKLLEECFKLFPETFRLASFVQWPDSKKIDRPLRDLRVKKMISGSSGSGFRLTKTGEKIAQEISGLFGQRRLGI